jgi:hypothetical protein
VVLDDGHVRLEIKIDGLRTLLGLETSADDDEVYEQRIPVTFAARRGALKIVIEGSQRGQEPQPDHALVKEVVRAHDWLRQLLSGDVAGTGDIARAEGLSRSYVSRVLRLAFLAPDIAEAIMVGRQPSHLTAWQLIDDRALPTNWREQRAALGFQDA